MARAAPKDEPGSSAPVPHRGTPRAAAGALAALVLAAALGWAYAPSLNGELQFDDELSIMKNPEVRDLRAPFAGLTLGRYLVGRPVTTWSFAVNYRLTGLAERPFHLVNLGIHLVATALVFALSRKAAARLSVAHPLGVGLLAAALFGLHPLQTESVAYVCQRAESLAAALYVGALLLLLGAEEASSRAARLGWLVAATIVAVLGMGAKATLVTLPLAYLLFRWAFRRGAGTPGSPLRRWGAPLALVGVAAAVTVAVLLALGTRGDAGFGVRRTTPWEYLLTESRVLWRYVQLILVPVGQNVDHDVAASRSLAEPWTLAASFGVVALVALAAAALARRPPAPSRAADKVLRAAAFGWLWFLLVLAPTSSVVPLNDVIAEHRVYLSLWGLALPVAVAWGELWARAERHFAARLALGAAVATIVFALTWGTGTRATLWKTREALWLDAMAKSPSRARPHLAVAAARSHAGRPAAAVPEYVRALELSGDGSVARHEVLRNLGADLISLGRLDEAVAALTEGSLLAPRNGELQNNLAIARLEQGALDLAEAHARRALALPPDDGAALCTLGEIQLARGDARAALESFTASMAKDPNVAVRAFNAAVAAEHLGLAPRACALYLEAARSSTTSELSEDIARARKALNCP